MDRVKLKKIISNYYMERLTLDQCADEVLELFNVVELKQECPVGADVYPSHVLEKKNTLPDEWSVWCPVDSEGVFKETVMSYLNNKYSTDLNVFSDRYYGVDFVINKHTTACSNRPFGRLLTFKEFQSMVDYNTKPSQKEMSKSNNTYPYQTKYILCKEKGLSNNT